MDKLIEKGNTTAQLAQAIGEALDITLKAANLVTVPMLDARFAQSETRMEARFGALEKALETTKVWAVLLYAGLAIALFGTLSVQQVRTDRLIADERARTERLIEEDRARTDRSIAEENARMEKISAEQRARAEQSEARMDAKFDQLRNLLSRRAPSGL
ncbi:MAG TPA: hypothetical protein VI653_04190 [Steroidobacteraceae bacterium]